MHRQLNKWLCRTQLVRVSATNLCYVYYFNSNPFFYNYQYSLYCHFQ